MPLLIKGSPCLVYTYCKPIMEVSMALMVGDDVYVECTIMMPGTSLAPTLFLEF